MSNKKISGNLINYAAFFVAVASIVLYLPSIHNDFVNWDDQDYIYENPNIQKIDWGFIKWIFTSFHASNWHPLTWLSHALDYRIWGLDPMGHHLSSILIHGINTFLVVILTTMLIEAGMKGKGEGGRRAALYGGVITGLLFGIHPAHVESVAWVSERKDVMYALFYLISVMAYIRYAGGGGRKWYVVSVGVYMMSLLSKPMAVPLPVVLLILDWYPYGRMDLGAGVKKVLVEKVPYVVLAGVSSVLTVMAQKAGGALVHFKAQFIGDRVLVAVRAVVFYLYKMLWPVELAPYYPYPSNISFTGYEYVGSIVVVVIITVLCIYQWKKGRRAYMAAWLYYIVSLLPVLGIVQVGMQAAADRYMYLPGLGLFIIAGLGTVRIYGMLKDGSVLTKPLSKVAVAGVVILAVSVLSVLTLRQTAEWKNSVTLWQYEIRGYPGFFMAFRGLGGAYMQEGNFRDAIENLDRSIELNPSDYLSFTKRGDAYNLLGEYDKALRDYETALSLREDVPAVYYNRGLIYTKAGDYMKAREDFLRTVSIDPGYYQAYYNLGIIYDSNIGNYDEAIRYYSMAIRHNPFYAKAYNNRGVAYGSIGDYRMAIKDLTEAIELDKTDITAYYNRGLAYSMIGDSTRAEMDFERARLFKMQKN
jgi:Tfp pilus assembly protein PilF